MKQGNIVGVVLLSILALMLIGIMVLGIIFKPNFTFSFGLFSFTTGITEENSKVIGEYSVPIKNIEEIQIKWKAGLVKLSTHSDSDEIKFTEKARKDADENKKLNYTTTDNKLVISTDSNISWRFLNFSQEEKILDISIPADKSDVLKSIVINSASADTSAKNITINNLKTETASGDISIIDCTMNSCSLSSMSGDIDVNNASPIDGKTINSISLSSTSGEILVSDCTVKTLEATSTSGDINIKSVTANDRLSSTTTSGYIENTNCKANVIEMNSTSGNIESDKSSSENMNIGTVSGDITCRGNHSKLNCGTTSGEIEANGEYTEIDINSISGDIDITTDVMPISVKYSTTSGNSELNIPLNSKNGFKASYSTTSGDFYSNLPITTTENTRVYGNGKYSYTFSSVSGDLNINSKNWL